MTCKLCYNIEIHLKEEVEVKKVTFGPGDEQGPEGRLGKETPELPSGTGMAVKEGFLP